ncbi:MAG: hypothetical protein AB8G22_07290 [Saprospiraceae bacterium]
MVDTIEVTYIAWACACANWLPTKYLKTPNYETTDNSEDCIFIEAENEELRIPDEYRLGGYGNRIKLIGQFYRDEGISRYYEQPTSQKPKIAKVFRYSKIEVIKPYSIWNFEKKDEEGLAKVVTIKKGEKAFYEKKK